MNNEIRNKIYLAALLHDIGKFYQRASNNRNKEGNNLSDQSRNIENYICPSYKNKLSHLHSVWTNEFFEKFEKKFGEIKNANLKVNKWTNDIFKEDNIANLASNHHLPHSDLQKLIQIADWWSAGIDRGENSNEDDNKNLKNSLNIKDFRDVPLFSIFNQIMLWNKECLGNQNVAFPLNELKIDKTSIFPIEFKQNNLPKLQTQYLNLWKKFETDFEQLPIGSFESFESSLLHLLRKYTWAISSNTMDMANVSLFDHLKTTAAIADCLYVAKIDEQYKNAFNFNGKYGSVNAGYYPVMLVGVDLSGIQSFIYDIASSKAAKSLKGRSFYLQLLAEAMLNKFKTNENINVKSAHVLYASGGKFYLLLPNTKTVKNAIEDIKKEVERELWNLHKGKLSINLACVPFAYRNNYKEKISWLEIEDYEQNPKQLKDLWKLLADKITKQKEQKFKSLLENNFDEFFDEKNEKLAVGGETKTCAVTGEEFLKKEKKYYLDEEKEIPVKQTVYEQTELGKKLKDADFIISSNTNIIEENTFLNKKSTSIKILDTNFFLFDEKDIKDENRKITSADFCNVQYINDTDFLKNDIEGLNISDGFQFYGGNKQADFSKNIEENGNVKNLKEPEKTFQDLAKTDKGENSLLGILRMDIDNLGKIFIEGFDAKRMSFSAFSTLSFHLDLFFSAYLNNLRNSENFKDWLNILYSGGDDLFVVGRWDKTIEFAELVRKEFEEYTKRNEIGISGGITFVHEKFPIAKAADMAGDAESASKKYPKEKSFDEKEKDAITFFGETISWKDEFEIVKNYKNQFVKYINDNNLSKGILHKLMLFANMKKENEIYVEKGEKEKLDYSYIWNTAYYLKRFAERFKYDKERMNTQDKKNKEVFEFIMGNKEKGGLQKDLFCPARNYDLVSLAARWAEIELKYQPKTKN